VPWSWLWAFLELCLLAAVVGDPAVDLLHARAAVAVAGIRRSARGPASLWQAITFGQLAGTAAGQQVSLTASSVTTTASPPVGTGLAVPFGGDTAALCTVPGSIAAPAAPGFCVLTAAEGGTVGIGAEVRAADGVARAGWKQTPSRSRVYGQNRLGATGPSFGKSWGVN
jgi:hypothetical protein